MVGNEDCRRRRHGITELNSFVWADVLWLKNTLKYTLDAMC